MDGNVMAALSEMKQSQYGDDETAGESEEAAGEAEGASAGDDESAVEGLPAMGDEEAPDPAAADEGVVETPDGQNVQAHASAENAEQ